MLVQTFSPVAAAQNRADFGVDGRRVVFLDRDGVINVNRADGVRSWSDLSILPAAIDGLALLSRRGWTVVVATNQALVNRGDLTALALFDLHTRMVSAIRDGGGDVAAVYACPHRPDEGCGCRKPAAGLLKAAAQQFAVDPRSCVFVGDHWTDLAAARAAGCRFVTVLSGRLTAADLLHRADIGDAVATDLLGAARYVVAQGRVEAPTLGAPRTALC
jgi:D-glycero-D-manno-heptose 1,7-bisphosphate phosphatase